MAIHDQDTAVEEVYQPLATPTVRADDCLVQIYRGWGRAAGGRIPLDRPVMRIGRDARNELVLEDDHVSRSHARIESRGKRWVLMDVGSTNGTLLNDRRLEGCVELAPGDRIKIGSSIFKFLSGDDVEAAWHEEIYSSTITDHLTGLPNRRHLDEVFAKEFSRARRHGLPTSLLMLDLDHFKQVNDGWGHLAGDAVLAAVARLVRTEARAEDTVARYGGEELTVLMPQTRLGDALAVAERIRAAVEAQVVYWEGQAIPVTLSIGCAELEPLDAGPEDLLRRADRKLYEAKHSGRNCVAA